MFSPKDPEEEITLTFDFSNLTTSVTNPEVTVSVYSGTDANPIAILDETPQIVQNNKVLQRVKVGVDGVNYLFRCKAIAANGDVLIHPDILPVRIVPYVS